MKQFEPTMQRSDKERILRQRQRDNVKARKTTLVQTSIGPLQQDIIDKAKEIKR